MSYADNLKLTLEQLANKVCREDTWYTRHIPSYSNMNTKLHRYIKRAGEGRMPPLDERDYSTVYSGWAGKRTKEQMKLRRSIASTRRRSKVARYVCDVSHGTLSNRIWGNAAFPILPEGITEVPSRFDYAVFVRNGKKGTVTFYANGGPMLTVDWKREDKKESDEIIMTWRRIMVKAEDDKEPRTLLFQRWKPSVPIA